MGGGEHGARGIDFKKEACNFSQKIYHSRGRGHWGFTWPKNAVGGKIGESKRGSFVIGKG